MKVNIHQTLLTAVVNLMVGLQTLLIAAWLWEVPFVQTWSVIIFGLPSIVVAVIGFWYLAWTGKSND